jgi:hypothetical protein
MATHGDPRTGTATSSLQSIRGPARTMALADWFATIDLGKPTGTRRAVMDELGAMLDDRRPATGDVVRLESSWQPREPAAVQEAA